MRNLFFVLVLANLGFAAWHAWYAGEPRTVPPPREQTAGITLVSELPPDAVAIGTPPSEIGADAPAVAPEAVETPAALHEAEPAVVDAEASSVAAAEDTPSSVAVDAPASGERCVSIGPFRELAQAAGAAASLREAGHEPTQRVADGEIWIGYWVYIEGIPSEAAANEVLAKVRAQGVADSYVIPNSDSGNLVSLGVFSEISGVTRRRDQVRALGYEPTVIDRTRRATVYWVDVVLAAEQTLDLESLQPPGRIVRLEQRNCAAAASQ
jgi:hypothetical protein